MGTTSHFNIATPLNTTLWAVMALSITFVWLASLAVGAAVALNPGPDAALNLAASLVTVAGVIGGTTVVLITGRPPRWHGATIRETPSTALGIQPPHPHRG